MGYRGLMMKKGLAPPENARYWRMLILSANGRPYVEVNELTMREQPGQPPMAEGGTYLIQSSQANASFYAFDKGAYGAGAVWRSVGNPATNPEYIGRGYDAYHGGKTKLRAIDVKIGSDTTAAPKDFDLQYSDNLSEWVTVMQVRNQTGWAAMETRAFTV